MRVGRWFFGLGGDHHLGLVVPPDKAIRMKQASPDANSVGKAKPPAASRRTMVAAGAVAASSGSQSTGPPSEPSGARWTFLTNHSHVLILLSRNPSMVLREVAALVGITERAVQRIIADLEEEGFIERERVGRQNHYRILADRALRHPVEAHRTVGDLLGLIDDSQGKPS